MKKMIRKILKEETIPDEIKKGIDVAIKVLKKIYPFVVGWEFSESPNTWTYKIYINLELNYDKALKYYGLKPHPTYHILTQRSIKNREKFPYPYSMMNYEEENFDVSEYQKLQEELKDIYNEFIPNRLKMKQGQKAVFDQDNPKELAVDNYIFVE